MKEISPQQGAPPLEPRPQRKKYRPCSLKMGKIQHFSACRGEEYFTAPHNTSRRGGFSFTPAPSVPHRRDKSRPVHLHQRPHNARRLPRLKPMTPMRVDHCHEMKPLTPLLPRSGQFQAIFQPQRRRRFHQTPNRAAVSQQGAQTLMHAASAMALIASSRYSPTRCTTWAWETGRTRPQQPDIHRRGWGSQTGTPPPLTEVTKPQPQRISTTAARGPRSPVDASRQASRVRRNAVAPGSWRPIERSCSQEARPRCD